MKAIIYVFSGTGNTRIAAGKIACALGEQGIETDVADVRLPYEVPSADGYDMVGLGYPVHAFNAPRIMRDFVRTLPETDGKRVFFFKTSGEPFKMNDSSSWLMYKILVKKGYVPGYEMHMLMPYNIMFRYKDPLVKQMYLHTCAMCRLLAKEVAEEKFRELRFRKGTNALAAAFRIQWFGADVNSYLLGVNKKRCTGCGACARRCPSGNITVEDGRVKFDGKCTMCMCCAMSCPNNAVRPGFLGPWKVNGLYPFKKLSEDESIAADYVNADTKGYFRLFRKYYDATYARLKEADIDVAE